MKDFFDGEIYEEIMQALEPRDILLALSTDGFKVTLAVRISTFLCLILQYPQSNLHCETL